MGVSENRGYLRVPLKGYYKGSIKGLGFRVWSVRKLGYLILGPYNKDPTLGYYIKVPYFGNPHIGFRAS